MQNKLFLMLLAGFVIGCGKKDNTQESSKLIPVKTQQVSYSTENIHHSYVGTAEGSSAISVNFSVGGNIERIMVSEGQTVHKGQLLAELSSVTAQNAYEASKAGLKQAQDAYDRMLELHQKGSLPDIKLIEVQTGLEQAKAMEAISKKSIDDCKLYSPIDGVVAQRQIEEGQTVTPGISSAFKIVSIRTININASIPENEIGNISIGQKATVQVAALNNKEYSGTVDIKGVEANPISHTYTITIKIDNAQREVIPGMVCKVFLQEPEGDNNKKIIIPNKSVQISPDGQRFVWVEEENKAHRRFITTGSLSDYGVVVESGLAEGEQLIIEGGNKVSEGMQVSIVK